jgi:hypothetical protein
MIDEGVYDVVFQVGSLVPINDLVCRIVYLGFVIVA